MTEDEIKSKCILIISKVFNVPPCMINSGMKFYNPPFIRKIDNTIFKNNDSFLRYDEYDFLFSPLDEINMADRINIGPIKTVGEYCVAIYACYKYDPVFLERYLNRKVNRWCFTWTAHFIIVLFNITFIPILFIFIILLGNYL